jgi:molybdopterin molybdotransferase
MDGFALRSSEAEGAAPGRPRALVVAGTAFAGAPFPGRLPRGAAVRIMTGAPLPAGADEVVPVEESEGGAAAGEVVRIFRGGLHFGNVRRRGEDLAKGALALPRGTRIGAAETALLAALGEARPLCARRPSVSILSIGDELVLPEERPEGGRVRDANGAALAAAVLEAGASPERLGVERDRARAIARRIAREVAAGADLLLVSGGGAKTGERDVTAEAVLSLGARPLFREVGLKPGKALAAYLLGRAGAAGRGRPRLLLSLPGNPVAALVGFWVAGRPALRAMQGARDPRLPEVPVRSPEGWEERPGRANLVRARLAPARPPAAGLVVEERLPEGAARLGALARANALLRYEGRGCAGDPVRAMLLPGVSFSWP